jgi:hypothetical protein
MQSPTFAVNIGAVRWFLLLAGLPLQQLNQHCSIFTNQNVGQFGGMQDLR